MKENKELKRTIERMTKEFNENKKIEEANAQMLLLEKNTKLAIQEKKEIEQILLNQEKFVDKLNKKIQNLESVLTKKKVDIIAKDETISHLNGTIEELQRNITSLKKDYKEKESKEVIKLKKIVNDLKIEIECKYRHNKMYSKRFKD